MFIMRGITTATRNYFLSADDWAYRAHKGQAIALFSKDCVAYEMLQTFRYTLPLAHYRS